MKYVAVVETGVDEQSGASANLNPAEIRQITAELRREAIENLPRGQYNIMTSETVQSMGGAVLEACADENCVITIGSKIGADYIVRGIISKFQTKLTLSVEMYETENGTLVALSTPVRSESPAELLEMAAAACANMYKKFANTQNAYVQRADTLAKDSSSRGGSVVARNRSNRKSVTVKSDSAKTSHIAYDADGNLIYAAKRSTQDSTKNVLAIDVTPLIVFPIIKSMVPDNNPLGIGLQYERKLDDKFSIVGKYTYYRHKDEFSSWVWSSHTHSIDISTRYYPTGKSLFLNGMLGYYAASNGNFVYAKQGESYASYVLPGQPKPYDFFKGGIYFGWQIKHSRGIIGDISFGWIFAFNDYHDSDNKSNFAYLMDGLMGSGSGPVFARTAFGLRF